MANQAIRTLNFNTPICGYHSKTTSKDYLGRQVKQSSSQHTHNSDKSNKPIKWFFCHNDGIAAY